MPQRRVLFLLQPGTNSRQIMIAIVQGFEDAGHVVQVCELAQVWQPLAQLTDAAQRRELLTQFANAVGSHIRQQRIDLVVSMWANGIASFPVYAHPTHPGKAQSFLEALGVPHLCYWLDAPHWASGGQGIQLGLTGALAGDRTLHVVNNEPIAREMRELLNMPHSHGMPYGVSQRQFAPPSPPPAITYDMVFQLGPGEAPPTPSMLAALEQDEPDLEAIRREVAKGIEQELAGAIASLATPLVRSQLAQRETPVLERLDTIARDDAGLRPAIAALKGNPAEYVRVTMRLRAIDAWYRSFMFTWLDRRFRCLRVGGQDMGPWPTRGDVQPFEVDTAKQSAYYAQGRCGLSVMRWQDDVGVHIKPYEISAVGVACVAMRRPGLSELFRDGEEILIFDTLPQAARAIERLQRETGLRERISAAALDRVKRTHTWAHRVPAMLDMVDTLAALPAAKP